MSTGKMDVWSSQVHKSYETFLSWPDQLLLDFDQVIFPDFSQGLRTKSGKYIHGMIIKAFYKETGIL